MNFWIKNRAFVGILCSIITAFCAILFFARPSVNAINESYNRCSLLMNSDMSFQIPSPSKNQLKALLKKGIISDYFSYYYTETKASVGKKSFDVVLLMSDTMNRIGFTMYSEKRIVSEGSEGQSVNYAYIDQQFAKRTGVGIGDKVSISIAGKTVDLVVTRIYENNTEFDKSVILCEYTGKQKNIYESAVSHVSYSGAFVRSDNISAAQNSFQNYIPEGKLRSRNEFDTDAAYNSFNNAIKDSDYSLEIVAYDSKNALSNFNKTKNDICRKFTLEMLAFVFVIIIENIILLNRKKEKDLFAELRNRSSIKTYRIMALFSELTFSLLIIYFGLKLLSFSVDSYLPYTYSSLGCFPLMGASIIGYVMGCVISRKSDKKQELETKEENKQRILFKKYLKGYIVEIRNYKFSDDDIDELISYIRGEEDDCDSVIDDLAEENFSKGAIKNIKTKLLNFRNSFSGIQKLKADSETFRWEYKTILTIMAYRSDKTNATRKELEKALKNQGFSVIDAERIIKSI